ncbi:MAG: hypothetical protein HQK69_00610 [Desulfamplus sp.]|nr:hypothetical protein [Desulfamplus sp.]
MNIYQFHEQLQSEGIIFCFSGPVSQSILEGMGETLKQKMDLEETKLTTSQKIFSIFVEQMQNIINYSADRNTLGDKQSNFGLGILIVGKNSEHSYVLAGNKISKEDEELLKQHLEFIKDMGKDELKSLYKERRKSGNNHLGSKGAGLGFIEMARKATYPLDFQFIDIDSTHSFFVINVKI